MHGAGAGRSHPGRRRDDDSWSRMTNAVTGIANASVSRSPVLVISGRPRTRARRPGWELSGYSSGRPGPADLSGRSRPSLKASCMLPRLELQSGRPRALVRRPDRPTSTFPRTCSRRSSADVDMGATTSSEPRVPEKPVPSQDIISTAAATDPRRQAALVESQEKGAGMLVPSSPGFLPLRPAARFISTGRRKGRGHPLDHPRAFRGACRSWQRPT